MKLQNIGIALSGGGIRAMIFHFGVFKWLAENKILEQVKRVSSVSGPKLSQRLCLIGKSEKNIWKLWHFVIRNNNFSQFCHKKATRNGAAFYHYRHLAIY